ncbi:hypothetical protein ACIBI0_38615 [Microbispora rosea]|uniref:hypothetical protein n=1 Tax=Microbispora rosea TaxID=58117 RepID=UPI003792FA8F
MITRRKLIIGALIAFAVFYVWRQPTTAGNTVQKGIGTVQTAGDRLVTFASAVLR